MATRILTLFDEEDFFQEEAAAAKPVKKEAPAGEPGQAPEATTPDNDTAAVAAIPQAPSETEIPQPEATANAQEQPVLAEEPEQEIEATIETTAVTDTPEPEATATEREQPAQEEEPEQNIEAAIEMTAVTDTPEPEATATGQEEPAQETETEIDVEAAIETPEVTDTPEPEATATEQEEDQEAIIKAADEELNKQIISELIQLDYTSLIHKDYPFDLNKAQVVTREKATPAPAVQPDMQEETVPGEDDMMEEEEVFEEIVPLPEWNLDKKYYTIGEVAQLFSVNTSHIRFWTNEFKLKPRTTRKGDRLYNPNDIAELRLIHHLVKEKKHTIKGAREKLKAEKSGVSDKLDLKESLTGLRDLLVQIKEQL